jgi:hypothetical protein
MGVGHVLARQHFPAVKPFCVFSLKGGLYQPEEWIQTYTAMVGSIKGTGGSCPIFCLKQEILISIKRAVLGRWRLVWAVGNGLETAVLLLLATGQAQVHIIRRQPLNAANLCRI